MMDPADKFLWIKERKRQFDLEKQNKKSGENISLELDKKRKAGREYYHRNAERIKAYKKEYYKNNIELLKEQTDNCKRRKKLGLIKGEVT